MRPSISESLIDWYQQHQRDLPWRRTSDPYAILVSEVMLQQTQVATVLPYFERFLQRFPTAKSLSESTEVDALSAWEGLGYYRRLRNLKASAKVVAENGWPEDLAALPGVGRYTSNAVASIAFGRSVACADGNVRRVMSRLAGREMSMLQAERASSELMGDRGAGSWNQAVMELGATVCTALSPSCSRCPLNSECVAAATGTQAVIPAPVRAKVVEVHHAYACFLSDGCVAIRKAASGEWWAGMYCFPRTEVGPGEAANDAVGRLGLEAPKHLGSLQHTVTKHRIRAEAFTGRGAPTEVEWKALAELVALPMPAPQRRIARWLEAAA